MVTCKICKNLSTLVIEADERGNIIKYKPNTCKLNNREIENIKNKCYLTKGE